MIFQLENKSPIICHFKHGSSHPHAQSSGKVRSVQKSEAVINMGKLYWVREAANRGLSVHFPSTRLCSWENNSRLRASHENAIRIGSSDVWNIKWNKQASSFKCLDFLFCVLVIAVHGSACSDPAPNIGILCISANFLRLGMQHRGEFCTWVRECVFDQMLPTSQTWKRLNSPFFSGYHCAWHNSSGVTGEKCLRREEQSWDLEASDFSPRIHPRVGENR